MTATLRTARAGRRCALAVVLLAVACLGTDGGAGWRLPTSLVGPPVRTGTNRGRRSHHPAPTADPDFSPERTPYDWIVAVEWADRMVHSARAPTATAVLRAWRRRQPTLAPALAAAELATATRSAAPRYLAGGHARTAGAAARFLRWYAAARDGSSSAVVASLGAFASSTADIRVGSAPRSTAGPEALAPSSWKLRSVALTAALSPALGRNRALAALRESVRSANAAGHVHSLLVLATVDAARDRPGARALARRALARARTTRDPALAFLAWNLLRELRRRPGRRGFACARLPRDAASLRVECSLAALEQSIELGDLERALALQPLVAAACRAFGTAMQSLRYASISIRLSNAVGYPSVAAEGAAQAVQVARRLGQRRLARAFTLARVTALRRSGRDAAAAALLEHLPGGKQAPGTAELWVERNLLAASGTGESMELPQPMPAPEAALARLRAGVPRARDPERLRRLVERRGKPWRPELRALATALIRARYADLRHQLAAAEEAYAEADRALRDWLARMSDPTSRWWLRSARQRLHDRLARERLRRGEAESALLLSAGATDDVVRQLRTHLAAGQAVLVVRPLGEQAWLWLLERDRVRARRLSVAPEQLRGLSEMWSAALDGAPTRWRRLGLRLADALLGDAIDRGWLDGIRTLVLVPALGLESVALAALPDPRRPGWLDDRLVCARAPSLAALERAYHEPPRRGSAAVFLPGSARRKEAHLLLRQHGGRVLRGRFATAERFLREGARAAVIHFGGHARPPTYGSLLGGLQFRPARGDDGFVSWARIARLDLRGSFAVLLGCETAHPGATAADRGSLPTSLAGAFLAAGSRAVVGTLWPLHDADAAALAGAFYRAGGTDGGAAALQRARAFLRAASPLNPRLWAGAVWEGVPDPPLPEGPVGIGPAH